MTSSEPGPNNQQDGARQRKSYKPSRALFFVMLAVIVSALVLFVAIGPLKGGGSGSSNSTSSPSGQH